MKKIKFNNIKKKIDPDTMIVGTYRLITSCPVPRCAEQQPKSGRNYLQINALFMSKPNRLFDFVLTKFQGWNTTFFWNSRISNITWNSEKSEKILEPGKTKKVL